MGEASVFACPVCGSSAAKPMFEKSGHQFARCSGCELEAISPPPTDETLAAIYGAHYYESWGLHDSESIVRQLKKRTFQSVLKRVGPPRGSKRLLDCGAATGFLLEVAADMGYSPYGLELSEFGANEIATKFGADHVFRGELQDCKFPDAGKDSFAAVTMCDYIEHVRDPRHVLSLAHDLLEQDGLIALTTPDAGSMSHRVLGSGWSHYKIEHLHYFNRANMKRLLEDVGFSSVTFYPLWKSLTLDYIGHQLDVYPHKILTPVAHGIQRVVPSTLRKAPMPFSTGELLAIARRNTKRTQ
jgi:2-polyprenyl-3-methyl-5-hydroxy-6-metoxy-1,4-benzoquinol methylase